MSTFEISNTTSGHTLGTFTGETALDAYQAMMRDAGYSDAEDAASAGLEWAEIPADIRVVEIDLLGIADDLGDQDVSVAAEHDRDPRAELESIESDFEAAVLAWRDEAGQAGDDATVRWASAVLGLEGDALATVRDAYIAGARRACEKIEQNRERRAK